MKKQINPTIKAHLIRSAFYVLVLLAVCVIPFTLAQSRSRGTGKQSAAQPRAVAPSAAGSVLVKPASNSSGKSTSAAASGLAPKPANLSGKSTSAAASAALASKSTVPDSSVKAADAATSAGAPGTRSLQIHKSPRHLTGTVLWYNGDFNGVNGLANEDNTALGSGEFASVYDDFNVPAGGWSVGAVFSDNLSSTTITGALWEIRQGISEGNGGTLIASGMTMTPVVTPTGRSGFGFTEFMIEVIGLNVSLPPGTYWLNVTPIGNLSGRSFDSTTSGTNCVGTPCGNNLNAFWNSNFFGANFTSTSNAGQPADFSMGVIGTAGGCDAVVNGGFETGTFPPWVVNNSNPAPFVASSPTYPVHSGTFSAHVGSLPGGETPGDSSFFQVITVPSSGGTLSFWYWPRTVDSITFDWQNADITDSTGNVVLANIMHVCNNNQAWL